MDFCVDGPHQITQHLCNYIKLAKIGSRTKTMSTISWVLLENSKVSSFYSPKAGPVTHGQTDGRTDGRTNIKFWGPSTQKALKGKKRVAHVVLLGRRILSWLHLHYVGPLPLSEILLPQPKLPVRRTRLRRTDRASFVVRQH